MATLLSFFVRPSWRRSTDLCGLAAILYRVLPLSLSSHSCRHCYCIDLSVVVLTALFNTCTLACCAVQLVSTSFCLLPRPFSLQPVACLAAISARSLPSIPMWAGTQCSSTSMPLFRRLLISHTIYLTRYWPELAPGLWTARIAAWLSIHTINFGLIADSRNECRRMLAARTIPYNSAEYTVCDVISPRYALVTVGSVSADTAAAPTLLLTPLPSMYM